MKQKFFRSVLVYACALLVAFFCLFPFVVQLSVSLKPINEWQEPNIIPKNPTFTAYAELLGFRQNVDEEKLPASVKRLLDRPGLSRAARNKILEKYIDTSDIFPFLKYMKNSLLFAGFASLFSIVLAVMGAYSVSRLNFPGRTWIQRSILMIYMINGILLMIPLFQIYAKLGLNQSNAGKALALGAVYVLQTLPVAIFMLGNYFRSIPYSLEEAAIIDGCSRFQAIIRIIIPLSLPMISSVFIYCFIIGWNEYLFASIFLKENRNMFTLPVALQTLFSSTNFIWGRIMAASVLTLLPVLLVYIATMGRNSSGLLAGGVKE